MNAPLNHLLYYEVFVKNPAAADMQQGFAATVILQTLSARPPSSLAETAGGIADTFPGLKFGPDVLRAAMDVLVTEGLVAPTGAVFGITDSGRKRLQDARTRTEESQQRFLDSVAKGAEAKLSSGLTPAEVAVVRDALSDLVTRVFLDEETSLSALFADLPDNGRQQLVAKHVTQHRERLVSALETRLGAGARLRARLVADALLAALGALDGLASAYLASVHYTAVASCFVRHRPEQVHAMRAMAAKWKLVLDTNVVLAVLFETSVYHPLVAPVLKAARALAIPLLVTKYTLDECYWVFSVAREVVRHARMDYSYESYLIGQRKAVASDYFLARRKDPALTYEQFEAIYAPTESVLEWRGIKKLEGLNYDTVEKSGLIDTCRNALRGKKQDRGRQPTPEGLEHDARLLVVMDRLAPGRNRQERPDQGYKLVTLDGTLGPSVSELKQTGRMPDLEYPMRPDAVGRVVIPIASANIDEEAYENYVSALFKSDLGLIADHRGFTDVILMSKIEQCGLPMRTILDKAGPDRDRVVERLVSDKGLAERLAARSRAPANDASADEAVKQEALKVIEGALAFRDEMDAELGDAKHRAEEAARARDQDRDELRKLRAELAQTVERQEAMAKEGRARDERQNRLLARWRVFAVVLVLALLGLGGFWFSRRTNSAGLPTELGPAAHQEFSDAASPAFER